MKSTVLIRPLFTRLSLSLSLIQQGSLLNPFLKSIQDYQAIEDNIHIGGQLEASWGAVDTVISGEKTSFLMQYAISQKTTISSITLKPHSVNGAAWKLKLFRYDIDTSTYKFIREASFTPSGTTKQTIPISLECDIADIPAIYVPASNQFAATYNPNIAMKTLNINGEITADNDLSTSVIYQGQPHIELFSKTRPFICVIGDSISEGANGLNNMFSGQMAVSIYADYVKSWPGGKRQFEPFYHTWSNIKELQYQNLSRTNIKWDEVLTLNNVSYAISRKPHTIIFALGTNSITAGKTINEVLASMDSCKTLCDAGNVQKIYITSILPRTQFDDSQSVLIRTWNTAYQNWCLENGATYIDVHDAMGQIRISTGFYDDLRAEYNNDNTHLTLIGATALGNLLYASIKIN